MADDYVSWLRTCLRGGRPAQQSSNTVVTTPQATPPGTAHSTAPQAKPASFPQFSEPQSRSVNIPQYLYSVPLDSPVSSQQNGELEVRARKPLDHRVRVLWDEPRDTFLLEYLIAATHLANLSGSFPMHVWEHLRDRFNAKFKESISVDQLKCRKENLKRMHNVVLRLRERENVEFDPQRLRFSASDELWEKLCDAEHRVALVKKKRVYWFPAVDELFRGQAARRQAARRNREMILLEGMQQLQQAARPDGAANDNLCGQAAWLSDAQPQPQPVSGFSDSGSENLAAGGISGDQMASTSFVSLPQDPMDGLHELQQRQERKAKRKLPPQEGDGERPWKRAQAAEVDGTAAKEAEGSAEDPVLKALRLVQEEDLTDEEKVQCVDLFLADHKVATAFHALKGSLRVLWLRQRLKLAG